MNTQALNEPAPARLSENIGLRLRQAAAILAVIGLALLAGFAITAVVSPDPVKAYAALLTGPLSSQNRFGLLIQDATILTLIGLALVVVFRAQQFSLLAEGQIYLGALAAGVVALYVPLPGVLTLLAALAAAGLAAFLYGLIPGAMKAYLNASELVASLMLNVIAQRFYEYVLIHHIQAENATFNWSEPFPAAASLPVLHAKTNINVMAIVAVLATAAVWLLLYRTPFGYELRMVGANRRFAHYGGVNTTKVIVLVMGLSGITAGLAGAYLSMGIQHRLVTNISAGMGFEGVMVALLARNNPLAVPLAALLYGYLRVGGDIMERTGGVSSDMVRLIQAMIILFLAGQAALDLHRRSRQPQPAPQAVAHE